VFISYDHSEDAHYKRLLEAWNKNEKFKFEFDNRSPGVAIESKEGAVIKASLTKMMKKADYLLVIVGQKTHSSKWVNWEIERALGPGRQSQAGRNQDRPRYGLFFIAPARLRPGVQAHQRWRPEKRRYAHRYPSVG